jgi:MoaA/NifB/PqqE/SkfB family radical SAM enzyme
MDASTFMPPAGVAQPAAMPQGGEAGCAPRFPWKLWIYTNYDCNLRCSYCVARSSPNAPRRAIGLANVQRLVDEAVALGFSRVFFTGGEPFILSDIYAMLSYSAARVNTVVLTNAMLLRGARLERLLAIASANLTAQVSLDGATAAQHDAYRGPGSWERAVEGITTLLANGVKVELSTTETPANTAHLAEICELHRSLGIPDDRHFVRPLARRGHSREGMELNMANMVPEVTANSGGIFWHPLSTDTDMQVSKHLFPLADAVQRIETHLEVLARTGQAPQLTFR